MLTGSQEQFTKIKVNMELQEFPDLKVNEVHIWSSSLLEDGNNMDYFYSILSEDEYERASSFRFFKDQRRFIMTRGILRCLLSHYVGQMPESIEFIYGLWGKPHLSQNIPLHFNLSHSGDYALYAVTRNYEIGIDLEYLDKSLELEGMAPHIFSAVELMDWMNLDIEERINAFFTHWVSREAFLKASGKGWIEDKKELPFNSQKRFRKKDINNEVTNPYCFECIPGYASALFIEGEVLRPLHYFLDHSNGYMRGIQNNFGKN